MKANAGMVVSRQGCYYHLRGLPLGGIIDSNGSGAIDSTVNDAMGPGESKLLMGSANHFG